MRIIEYTLPCGRDRAAFTSAVEPKSADRAPRLARMLALAHKLDSLVRSGAIRDYGQLARLGRITPSRLSQILMLLNLAPAIQEQVLFLSPAAARAVAELELREIARLPLWAQQQERFENLRNRHR